MPMASGALALATLSLPKAKYFAFGRAVVTNNTSEQHGAGCSIGNGVSASDTAGVNLAAGADQTITLVGPIAEPFMSLEPTIQLALVCSVSGTITPGTVDFNHIQLSAIQVGALNFP